MFAYGQDPIIRKHLFTAEPDLTEFDKDLSEFNSIQLSALKFRNHLMPLILEVACGQYGFRSAQYAAGVHTEAFAHLLKKADIRLLIAYNDPLTIAFYNASAEVAKSFFEHYMFLNNKDERILSSIISAIYAVKQRPDGDDKTEILRFLEENRSVLIQGQTIGTFLDMPADKLKQHEKFNSLIAVDRTVDQIASDHIMNELGGSLPYAEPEKMDSPIVQRFPSFEMSSHPKRTLDEECCYRFKHSKKNDVTYGDLIDAIEHRTRISRQDDDAPNHLLVYLPKVTACLFRNIREETTGQPLLVYAVNKGLRSATNPEGIRRENLDELLRRLQDDMTVPNNPNDPLMAACYKGDQEMFVYFFEKYLGYRNLRVHYPTDIHGKEFILNDYIKNAIQYFAHNKQATNRDAILEYLWKFDGIGILIGSNATISVKDFLIQNKCVVDVSAAKVTFN
ncbi:MAG: hypothetical protein WC748_05955 [Legionellales bacterium]|jgi:hypothetical protein